MINIKHLIKVAFAWTSIVYTVCFAGVALMPGIRPFFMMNALHIANPQMMSITTFGTFFSGLVLWNLIAGLAVWLFAALFNHIKS